MGKIKNFFKKVGDKISNNKIYKFLFVDSVILKLLLSIVIACSLFFVAEHFDIFWVWYPGLVFLGYGLLLFLIGLVYAWIINPIRRHREGKKEK
jgi:hypothetical protein